MAEDTEHTLFSADTYDVKSRTRASGKSYTSVRIQVTPVVHNLVSEQIGKDVVESIAEILRERILAISADAAPATIRRRQVAQRALAAGADWAVKRYRGGRSGGKEPGLTTKLFNDSRRLAEGLVVRFASRVLEDSVWFISVPANRLDPTEFKGDSFQRMIQRLVELVPELGGGDALWQHPKFQEALGKSVERLTKAEQSKQAQFWADLGMGALRLAERILT